MTTLVLAHKDDNAILEASALCVRSALVNKLYYTDVCCEWVSCLHFLSIFWNSFWETEITTISQMMCTAMSSNSFAIVKFATAKLKMKTLPSGFSMALCSTAIQFFRSTWSSKFSPPPNCWFCLWRCWCSGRIGLRDCRVSVMRASCFLKHCIFLAWIFHIIWSFFCIKCFRAFCIFGWIFSWIFGWLFVQLFAQICHGSTDTELIYRNHCAEKQLDVSFILVEVGRLLAMSCAS